MTFEFISVPRLRFGPGTFDEIGAMVRECGRRAIVVGGRSPARANRVVERLNQAGVSSSTFSVPTEPDVECATKGAEAAREFRADVVVGVGGGSAAGSSDDSVASSWAMNAAASSRVNLPAAWRWVNPIGPRASRKSVCPASWSSVRSLSTSRRDAGGPDGCPNAMSPVSPPDDAVPRMDPTLTEVVAREVCG